MNSKNKLTDNKMWQEANHIAEFMYAQIDDLPPYEEWESKRKFRTASSDLIFYIAQALGSNNLESREYDWNSARKYLFALQTVYRFACKQGFLELDPNMMVRMDKLIGQIDDEQKKTKKAADERVKEDLRPWLDKYKLWKEMNK